LADIHDHTLIGTRLSFHPFVHNQTKANLHSLSALRRFAPKADAAEFAKALTLADRHAWRQAFEIRVKTDEHSVIHFTHSSDERVGRILSDPFPQQNDLVAGIAENTTDRIRNAMVDKKSYRERLCH
jgi:hypothetical protein